MAHELDEQLVRVFADVSAHPAEQWGVDESCEDLVDVEDAVRSQIGG